MEVGTFNTGADTKSERLQPRLFPSLSLPLQQLVGVAFVFVSFFPWVSLGLNTLDSQPWALLLASIFLYVSVRVAFDARLLRLLLLVPAVLLVGLLDFESFGFRFYRSVYAYSSVPLLIISYYIYVRRFGVPLTAVKTANVIYLGVAIVQQVFGPAIMGGLTVIRTTPDRGMPSLAVEPTYFGMVLLFFSWLIYLANDYRPRRGDFLLVAANVLFLVFVAKSSMAIAFLTIAVLLSLFYRFRFRLYLLLLALGLAATVGYVQFLQATRVGTLVRLVQDQGLIGLVRSDPSVNVRVAHAVYPWHGAVTTFFVPHGFSSFADIYDVVKQSYGGFFWYGEKSDAIMSYAGAFVFELGFIGLMFLGYVFCLLFRFNRQRILELAFLFALMNSALPVAFPLIPLLIVVLYVQTGPDSGRSAGSFTATRKPQIPASRKIEESATTPFGR
jgi:hypothetical protein